MHAAFKQGSPLVAAIGVMALAGCGAPAPPLDSEPASRPTDTAPRPVAGGNVDDAARRVAVTLGALLAHEAPALEQGRNPFRFGPTSGGAEPASMPEAPSAAVLQERAEPGGATGPPAMPPAPDPVAPIRFIGVVEARNRPGRVAVLTDGTRVYHGLVNDVVSGRYRILGISETSIELEDLAHGTRLNLRLSES